MTKSDLRNEVADHVDPFMQWLKRERKAYGHKASLADFRGHVGEVIRRDPKIRDMALNTLVDAVVADWADRRGHRGGEP